MHSSPHTHKYFGVLIAVIVLAVLVLGVRVGKLSELSATVSLQRTPSSVTAKLAPAKFSTPPVANGTVEQFLNIAFGSNALSGSAAKAAFQKTHNGKDPFPAGRQPKKLVPKITKKVLAPINAAVSPQ